MPLEAEEQGKNDDDDIEEQVDAPVANRLKLQPRARVPTPLRPTRA